MFRVTVTFDGALESDDVFDVPGDAILHFDSEVEDLTTNYLHKHWTVAFGIEYGPIDCSETDWTRSIENDPDLGTLTER